MGRLGPKINEIMIKNSCFEAVSDEVWKSDFLGPGVRTPECQVCHTLYGGEPQELAAIHCMWGGGVIQPRGMSNRVQKGPSVALHEKVVKS